MNAVARQGPRSYRADRPLGWLGTGLRRVWELWKLSLVLSAGVPKLVDFSMMVVTKMEMDTTSAHKSKRRCSSSSFHCPPLPSTSWRVGRLFFEHYTCHWNHAEGGRTMSKKRNCRGGEACDNDKRPVHFTLHFCVGALMAAMQRLKTWGLRVIHASPEVCELFWDHQDQTTDVFGVYQIWRTLRRDIPQSGKSTLAVCIKTPHARSSSPPLSCHHRQPFPFAFRVARSEDLWSLSEMMSPVPSELNQIPVLAQGKQFSYTVDSPLHSLKW